MVELRCLVDAHYLHQGEVAVASEHQVASGRSAAEASVRADQIDYVLNELNGSRCDAEWREFVAVGGVALMAADRTGGVTVLFLVYPGLQALLMHPHGGPLTLAGGYPPVPGEFVEVSFFVLCVRDVAYPTVV